MRYLIGILAIMVAATVAARPACATDDDTDTFQGLSALLEEEGLLDLEPESDIATDGDDQFDLRLNPDMGADDPTKSSFNYVRPYPAYINRGANRILDNGADWAALAAKLHEAKQGRGTFNIVHIGDSHLQSDGATGKTRRLLQQEYGRAGRGLILPFKMAGTNEPRDYHITSTSPWSTAILLRTPWAVQPGFTGVGIRPKNPEGFDLTVSTKTSNFPADPFSTLRIFYSGATLQARGVTNDIGMQERYTAHTQPGCLTISLERALSDVHLELGADAPVTIAGIELTNDRPGVLYNAYGNNGAAYVSYNNLGGTGAGISAMRPDLVIISLGTNEAFGRTSDADFYDQVDRLVRDIATHNPQAQLLLTTPMECQRRTTKTTGRGRRRRTKTSYAVNQNVARLRNVIARYGAAHGIPVYDFYAAAGGAGASGRWLADRLMNTDRVHLTWDGYDLQGRMMYDALQGAFNHYNPN